MRTKTAKLVERKCQNCDSWAKLAGRTNGHCEHRERYTSPTFWCDGFDIEMPKGMIEADTGKYLVITNKDK